MRVTRRCPRTSPALFLLLSLSTVAVVPRMSAQPAPYAAELARAYEALAAGRYAEALRIGEAILGAEARHHAAATVVVLAAAQSGAAAGLDAYERWLGAIHHEDAFVLEPVAVAALTEIARGPAGQSGLKPRGDSPRRASA